MANVTSVPSGHDFPSVSARVAVTGAGGHTSGGKMMIADHARVSRRGMLLGSLGVGLAAFAGCGTRSGSNPGELTAPDALADRLSPTSSPPTTADSVLVDRVYSPARGTSVDLIVMRPAGVSGRLPACLALHGRGSGARAFLDLGIPRMLTEAVRANVPPFAVVAVDGGDSYWVGRQAGDDPQRMLREDVPTWLSSRGLVDRPFATFGISMGAYGALNLARMPGISAVGAISPALFTSWSDAKARAAFVDQARWEATEPLRHLDSLSFVPLGVWCGTADPFLRAAKRLVNGAQPAVSVIDSGGHDDGYWRRVLPDVLRFIGERR